MKHIIHYAVAPGSSNDVYYVACQPEGVYLSGLDTAGVYHQFSRYPTSYSWVVNAHHVWCEKCLATKVHQEAIYEVEIGFDGDVIAWWDAKKENV